jgi:hypothetical protein
VNTEHWIQFIAARVRARTEQQEQQETERVNAEQIPSSVPVRRISGFHAMLQPSARITRHEFVTSCQVIENASSTLEFIAATCTRKLDRSTIQWISMDSTVDIDGARVRVARSQKD